MESKVELSISFCGAALKYCPGLRQDRLLETRRYKVCFTIYRKSFQTLLYPFLLAVTLHLKVTITWKLQMIESIMLDPPIYWGVTKNYHSSPNSLTSPTYNIFMKLQHISVSGELLLFISVRKLRFERYAFHLCCFKTLVAPRSSVLWNYMVKTVFNISPEIS